ncbi:MAG: ATP-binding protein [Cyanobacteria bacterium P01_F01_bin.53]
MSNAPINVLLVEDNAADAYLIWKLLSNETNISLTHVERLDDAIDSLQQTHFDAILLDLTLPDSRNLATVKEMHAADVELPIIVLTGLDDEDIAISALREGAQDYLVKGEIQKSGLVRAIHYAIERQQTLDKLQHLNQELARSNQELESFAYAVSHDLQQPLQSISGFAQILIMTQRERLDDDANDYVDRIVASSKQMSLLIQDLLAYARVGAAEQPHEPTDCQQLVAEILAELGPNIEEKQAKINIEPLPTIEGNPSQLRQLFQNLLSNALKYHPPERAPQVTVSAALKEGTWQFGVQDNGIGIEPEYFDKIFQIFERLHRKDDYPGTGIGLATCKKIVESHGGHIWVASEPGKGTTVYFTLPAPVDKTVLSGKHDS